MDRMAKEPLHDYVSRGFGTTTELYEKIRPEYETVYEQGGVTLLKRRHG